MLKIKNSIFLMTFSLVIFVFVNFYEKTLPKSYVGIFTIPNNTTLSVNNDVSTTIEYNKIHLPIINTFKDM